MAQDLVSDADEFGSRLSIALKVLNLSRSQFSATLGVHKSLVSRWLSGQVQPTSYNLARISALFAKLRPGFNMTLWAAPRADFEAALGMPAAAATPIAETLKAPTAKQTTPAAPFRRQVDWRWSYTLPALAVVLLIAFGSWMLGRIEQRPAQRNPSPLAPTTASVAVLPFLNMSGDPAKDYLGDGISEEILNDLSNTPGLRVASRTSSFSFSRKNADIGAIAQKLNVRAVLEGSVRQEGDRVRIVAQLINGRDGFHIWSARYDRGIDDILAVQDEIARAITAALGQRLVPSHAKRRTINAKAYQDYLQAQYFFKQRTLNGYGRAKDLLDDAIARQPDFANAYALRGHLAMLAIPVNPNALAKAQQMTAEALRLDPGNREALDTDLQTTLTTLDWGRMYRDAHRLLAMPKRDALAYSGLHFFYEFMGFPKEGLEAARWAAELEPLHFPYRHYFELSLWQAGRLQEALAAAEAALEIQPGHTMILHELCVLSARLRKMEPARAYARQLAAQPKGGWGWLLKDCEIEIALGTATAAQTHSILDGIDRNSYFDKSTLGQHYARIGDFAEAVRLFSAAYEKRDVPGLVSTRYDPVTPPRLLQDARWKSLWQRPLLQDWQRWHNRIAADLARRK